MKPNVKKSKENQSVYRDIFYKDFNYNFKPPSKNTCKTCDMLDIQIKAGRDKPETFRNVEKLRADEEKHVKHMTESNTVRQELQNDQNVPKNDPSKATIIPKLTTGVAYYKRQLWVYNLGTHAFQNEDDKVYMFMWHEGVAYRGTQ